MVTVTLNRTQPATVWIRRQQLATLTVLFAAAAAAFGDEQREQRLSVTIPSLQGVVMPTLDPEYRYFHESWDALRVLDAQLMLFGPWFVYPRYAIQELWPPSSHLCGHLNGDAMGNNGSVTMRCANGTVEAVEVALWGHPAGFCGNFTRPSGNCTTDVSEHVAKLCVGKRSCTIHANSSTLGSWRAGCYDGSSSTHQQAHCPLQLSVQLRCSVQQTHTYWDTQWLDPQIEAYFEASEAAEVQTALGWGGHPNWLVSAHPTTLDDDHDDKTDPINTACSVPCLLYSALLCLACPTAASPTIVISVHCCRHHTQYEDGFFYNESDYSFVPDDYFDSDFHYEQGRILRDPSGTELGDYYGRSLAHFIAGGHTDEAGNFHKGYNYNVTIFQSINEPEAEHKCNYTEYTRRYDAIVEGIWRHADPDHKLEFLMGQLSGHREWDWYHFMLNSSNHRPGIPIDWLSYHFYSTAHSLDDSALENLFDQADGFLDEVSEIQTIIEQYTATSTTGKKAKNFIDEIGCFAPVGAGTMNPSETLFWNACGGMFAYLFGHFTVLGIEYAGTSQLMGFPEIKGEDLAHLFLARPPGTKIPTQVPSVTIIDPMTGRPNSRYWVLKLLIDEISPGVAFVNSTFGVVATPIPQPPPPPPPHPLPDRRFCGSVRDPSYLLTLSCDEPNATISDIVFADYGRPSGGCTAPRKDPSCSSAELDHVVGTNCTGKRNCTINTYWPGVTPHVDPCLGKVKTLRVVARCSSGEGTASNSTGSGSGLPVYTQGYGSGTVAGAGRKLLVVNRRAVTYQLELKHRAGFADEDDEADAGGGTRSLVGGLARVVDQASGEGWYRNETIGEDGVLRLAPFAVAVLHLPEA